MALFSTYYQPYSVCCLRVKVIQGYWHPGLENIMIFSKLSKYRKYQKYHDIFDIFDIFQKMKI